MGVAASRQEAFWEACGFGHKERVKKFLESGDIDVNWVSYTVSKYKWNMYTVKPVLRGHFWDKEKVAL